MPLSSMDFVRRTSFLGITILLSGGVVGCGGGEEEPAATASSGSSAPAAPAAPGDNGGDTVAAAPALMAPEAANAPQAPDSGESPDAVAGGQMSGPPPGMSMSGPPGMMGMSGPPGMSSAAGGAAGAQFESAGPIGSGDPADMSMAGSYPGMQSGGYPGMQPAMGANIPVSNRPAKVSDWSDEELKTAVIERDRRTLEALTARVKKSPGDPKVAELIVALLAASNEAPPQPAQNPAGAFGAPSMGPPGMMPQGAVPSMGPPGMSTPGSSGPAMAPPKGGFSGAPGMGPGAPQSRYVPRRALNSLEAMILESATAWQQPGVGAIASGFQAPGSGKVPAGAMTSGPPGLPSPDASGGGAGFPNSGPPGMPMMSGPGMMAPGMSMPGSMPGSMNSGADASGSLTDEELVRGLADGLVQNKSPLAWQTLFALVSGSVKTPLDAPKNAEIVVFSLCRNFNSDPAQIGQVLTALLDGSAPIPGESRVACLKALASVSGQAMDMNTGFQAGASTGLPAGGPGGFPGSGMMGMGSMPPGMAAGMAQGGASTAAPSLMAPGASMAAPGLMAPGAMSSGAGGMIEPSGEPGFNTAAASPTVTMPGERIPDNVLKEVVKVLWGDACVNAVAKNLATATDLSSAEALLMLGASMPNPKVREAELEFLTRIHSAGGDGLTNTGLVSGIARDPGFLVVLKSLPRSKAARGEDKNHLDSWAVARQTMVLSLRDQLRAASAGGGKMKSVGEGFPIRLHRGGTAEYSGVLTVPAAEFGGAKGSEMKVYYARTTSTAQRKREEDELISHYEQKASGKGKLDQSKGLLWIDGTKTAANGVRRSMDVFISTGTSSSPGGFPGGGAAGPAMEGGAPGGGGAGGPTMTYPIEIVVVEVTDPKGAEAEAVPTGEPVKQ